MKHFYVSLLLFVGIVVFCPAQQAGEENGSKADTSYAFGMLIASDFQEAGLELDYDAFMQGFLDVMEHNETRFTQEKALEHIEAAFSASLTDAREQNLAQGAAFLEENAKRSGVIVTPSGLQYELISEGAGETPVLSDTVLVHYEGRTIDDVIFDTTQASGRPLEIPLERVIPGWSEGLRMMKEGGRARLYIPPDLAYGEYGAGIIGPNSVIIFDVELLEIIR